MVFKIVEEGSRTRPQKFSLAREAAWADLTAAVAEALSLPAGTAFDLLAGFPPRKLDAPGGQALGELFPAGREALVLRRVSGASSAGGAGGAGGAGEPPAAPRASPRSAPAEARVASAAAPKPGPGPGPGPAGVRRREVPADGNCLFTSIAIALGGPACAGAASLLRGVVSEAVLANEALWPMLDRDAPAYAAWIQDPRHWGGELELVLLAAHFRVEICAVSVETGNVHRYGPGPPELCAGHFSRAVSAAASLPPQLGAFEGAGEMAMVIFDGVHYDLLEGTDGRALFPAGDAAALRMAAERAAEARATGAFVNRSTFSLRCNVCGFRCKGEADAMAHAKATGHSDFGQLQ